MPCPANPLLLPAGPSGLSLNPNAMAALSLLSGSGKGSLADDVAAAGSTTHTFLMAAQSGAHVHMQPHRALRLLSIRCPAGDPSSSAAYSMRAPHPLTTPRHPSPCTSFLPAGRLLNSMGAEPGRQQDVGSVVANITRPALQRTLYAALPPGIVTCSASFRSFEQREGGRVAVRLAVGGKEVEEECDVLVGADGIRSTVRRHLEGKRSGGAAACVPAHLPHMGSARG